MGEGRGRGANVLLSAALMKCSRAQLRTWNAAMEAVQAEIVAMLKRYRLTPKQRQALEAARVHCGALKARRFLRNKPTNRDLARKYQVSLRTVTNWRREGCPFGRGQRAVIRWIGRRRYAPAGTKAKFKAQLKRDELGAMMDNLHAATEEVRRLKLLHRVHRLPVPDWMRGFRSAPL